MASSKYERELKFISTETKRLGRELEELKEVLPDNPAQAQEKAGKAEELETKIAELLSRKKEIEDSFVAAGLEIPDISHSINENGCRDTVADSDYVKPEPLQATQIRPAASEEELTAQIGDITDELMQLEIKMLRADMDGNQAEKQKLGMEASVLRSRRDSLVEDMKSLREGDEKPAEAPADNARIDGLEADTRALRSQIADVRSDVVEIKEQLRQILEALRLE